MTNKREAQWKREKEGLQEAMEMLMRMSTTLSHEGRRQAQKIAKLYTEGASFERGVDNALAICTPISVDGKRVKETETQIWAHPNGEILEIIIEHKDYNIGEDGMRLHPIMDYPQT